MLLPESGVRVWLYAPPTDMRKSFDGLSALVRRKLAEDPTSGQLFVFINRRRTQMKVLYFEQGGYCLWSKRLEAGRFHCNTQAGDKVRLSWTELKLIIEGIDLRSVRRFKRYRK
jgi:transposase